MTEGHAGDLASARGMVGAAAKALMARAGVLAGRAHALLGASEALRERAGDQLGGLLDELVRTELAQRPITDLRGLVGKGVRLNVLDDAGYSTVERVLRVDVHRLQAVQGVGQQSARQVHAAARRLARDTRLEVRFRFDPDRKRPAETQLLATLAAARRAGGVPQEPLRRFVARAEALVRAAEPTSSRAGMLFRFGSRKQDALVALARLDALLSDPSTRALFQEVEQLERAVDPATHRPDQVWREFGQDAAAFTALVSTLTGHRDDEREAAQGFLPDELRQAISAVPLDTRRLRATLRGYQVFGAQYAIHRERAVLGDEMGLGKTVQALATIAHLAANGQTRFLVVCPASVQVNWLNEISKHTDLTGHSLHGADRLIAMHHWLRTGGVAVTTFTTLGKLTGITGSGIALVVVDEAHYVKNPNAQRARHVAAVVGEAQRALFLTGTPMENRVEEFRNLVEHLQPAVARGLDPADALAGAKRFRRAVASVYLRRNQEDVLTELPDKIEVEDWVRFSPDDSAAYEQAVRSGNFMAMRRAAFASSQSAKLERLVEVVREAREDGLKVLVFSTFLDVLEVVRVALGAAVVGVITGAVPPAARQRVVDDFTRREGHAVLLSQIDAGGVGLNVQAASVVIIAEPQWKPGTEEQAIARAHRMGQVRKVQVHRLLAQSSVDERIREVQERKSTLFDEFARKSDAKDADRRATDTTEHRPADDGAAVTEQGIVRAEQHRLGITA
ncbi:DEAD/DEAH box helicase [Actinokineospora bangkokensis]|uniref:Helicase SNF2 n=1 Tax=Actinokineospora bangkokensis TaxID=1193682 RepID=A0A1Q9LQS6_9PSEU|nr:SNF2-related protein [Actinokineospora bangkokensis]OLR94370.1 helicase SNF2 [Actinokineospora bangkokensis]